LSDFRIFETSEFGKALEKMGAAESDFMRRKLSSRVYPQLRIEPFFGANIKKLRGYSPETWRYRVGGFRLFYSIDESERIVHMLTVEARRDAYR
jgi:mRNA interferase RelE/StbE